MSSPRRIGQVIRLRPEAIDVYEQRHRDVPEDLLAAVRAANIRDYSIFRHRDLLFARWDYVGDDLEVDLAHLAALPVSIAWEKEMRDYQLPVDEPAGDWWRVIPEIFHLD